MTRAGAVVSVLAIVGAVGLTGAANAQSVTMKSTCQNIGGAAVEPFGTEAGQSLREATYSCSVSDGPLNGGATTGTNFWLIKGTDWTLLSGQGAMRSPNGAAVFQVQDGTLKIEMKDGKVSRWTASGRGRYIAASGAASALSGKTYQWKVNPSGPTSFVIETTVD
jgi:hypothetical protein